MYDYYRNEIRTFYKNINLAMYGSENIIVISVAVIIIIRG